MNLTRRHLLISTLAAPLGAVAAEVPNGHCPGCTQAADPEAKAIGVADVLCAQTTPPKPLPVRRRPHLAPKEPDTWFNIIFGGEYWYEHREVTQQILDAIRKVRPDVVHASMFGPELLGALPTGGKIIGVTRMSPSGVTSVREYLAWWKKIIDEVHRIGAKVQATTSMTLVYDTKSRDKGFFHYYNDLWETDILGPKPVADPLELFQRDAEGHPLLGPHGEQSFESPPKEPVYAYLGCENNPHWRQLLKQFATAGIKVGFDGFMVQFNYRYECMCRYCQEAFRHYWLANHSADCLRDRYGIADPATALLDTTRDRGPDLVQPGVQKCDQPGPLALEGWQFTSETVRDALQEVFLEYGRSLKPDLFVSSWTHQRRFLLPGVDYQTEGINSFNERILLPPDRWGRGENYIWCCIGAPKSNLKEYNAGDSSLSAKYIYAMDRGKAFMAQKYDFVRLRLTLAEAWAHRSIGLALDRPGFQEVLEPYFAFAHRYREMYYPSDSYAELGLLFTRRAMYRDDASFLTPFDHFARAMFDDHILFDVLIDQHLADTDISRYRAILLPTTAYLSPAERKQIRAFRDAGGLVVVPAGNAPAKMRVALESRTVLAPETSDNKALAGFIRDAVSREAKENESGLSGCDAPWTVQTTAWHQPHARRILVHLVNYDRDESVADQENPRATGPVNLRLNLPLGANVAGVRLVTPEHPEPQTLTASHENGQAVFQVPSFLVYGVAMLEY